MSDALTTLGIIGDPVAHSLSPAMHGAALRALAIPERYGRWLTPADQLEQRIAGLRRPPLRGANVTLPHKVAVAVLLDRVVDVAAQLGAVNTIVREADGTLTGHNTDAPALRDSLWALGIGSHDRAVVLGAGGAARAALWALHACDCAVITIANRTPERARKLLQAIGSNATVIEPADLPDAVSDATLLINATSLGWHASDDPPLDLSLLHADMFVYDLVYQATPLLRAAHAAGARTCDGLDMLVRQAALAFELWFDIAAPVAVMHQAVREALDQREGTGV